MRPSHRRHNRMWPRRPRRKPENVSTFEILKGLYPQSRIGGRNYARPAYARLAYDRKWISLRQYLDIPEEWDGREPWGLFNASPSQETA